jgi:hypothetical protein
MLCAAAPTTYSPGTNSVMSVRRYCDAAAMGDVVAAPIAEGTESADGVRQRRIENDIWWQDGAQT